MSRVTQDDHSQLWHPPTSTDCVRHFALTIILPPPPPALGIECKTSHMPGKCFTAETYPQPFICFSF